MSTTQFYDDLAEYYDLIYADWDKSMLRQGEAIAQVLLDHFPERAGEGLRLLDVSAGIGTQNRGLSIDGATADMRRVSETVEGCFDSVLCPDNSLPHLQTDSEISGALDQFRRVLGAGGLVLISVRDYAEVDRKPNSAHAYGERRRGTQEFRLGQTWEWLDSSHYRTTFLIEEFRGGGWERVCETQSTYYAISIPRLLELVEAAGFASCGQNDSSFFQPVPTGRAAG